MASDTGIAACCACASGRGCSSKKDALTTAAVLILRRVADEATFSDDETAGERAFDYDRTVALYLANHGLEPDRAVNSFIGER